MELQTKELLNIRGGGISFGAIALIGAGVAFVIGIIDGFTRPLKCNKWRRR